jgi:hypothetical protein
MSVVANLQEQLQETARKIAELEHDLVRYPDMTAILMNIKSLEKAKKRLEEDLLVETETVAREVVDTQSCQKTAG